MANSHRRDIGAAWAGIAAGPAAWFLGQQVTYALAPCACAGDRWPIFAAGALFAPTALGGAAVPGGRMGVPTVATAASWRGSGCGWRCCSCWRSPGQTMAALIFTGCER